METANRFVRLQKVRVKTWNQLCNIAASKGGRVGSNVINITDGGYDFTSNMRKFCGRKSSIRSVGEESYTLYIDTAGNAYHDWMLEPVEGK